MRGAQALLLAPGRAAAARIALLRRQPPLAPVLGCRCWSSKSGGRDGDIKLPSEDVIAAIVQQLESRDRPPQRRRPELGLLGKYEQPGGYAFRVGDVVVHRVYSQVGVVAERFEVCQMSEEWHRANGPQGMNRHQPFYSILVNMPGFAFTRHGAQSSHRRWDPSLDGGLPPPISHPDFQELFFVDLDGENVRYTPRNKVTVGTLVRARKDFNKYFREGDAGTVNAVEDGKFFVTWDRTGKRAGIAIATWEDWMEITSEAASDQDAPCLEWDKVAE